MRSAVENGGEKPFAFALAKALGEGVLSAGVNGAPTDVGVGVMLLLVEGVVELKLLLGERRRTGESSRRVWTSSAGGPGDIGWPPTKGPSTMLIELRFELPPPIVTGEDGEA